jgi:predicted nucleotidyltransferase
MGTTKNFSDYQEIGKDYFSKKDVFPIELDENDILSEKLYSTEVKKRDLDHITRCIIKTLLYFDIFSYPLTKSEIAQYCQGADARDEEVFLALKYLERKGMLFRFGEMYSLQNKPELKIRRLKGNEEAKKFIGIAHRMSKLISLFPFVRGVYLSGALSKGYADKDSDIDYFIVTAPGRLWVCRTFLILFKKIFLLNSKKYFCVNYFIDTDHLEIPDKNIFTATELAFLIPTYNMELYEDLMRTNDWGCFYYPNLKKLKKVSGKSVSFPVVKKFAEWIFNGKAGELLDKYFFGVTFSHWQKKFGFLTDAELELNFRSRPYVSKHHPQGMQIRVLKILDEKIQTFETRFQLKLN